MFHCCFIEFLLSSLWRIFSDALMFLNRILTIRSLFRVLISETFMFLYWVSDDSLMILRRSIVDTAKISMQTVRIICLFELLIFETRMFLLLLHCWFLDDSLMRHWWTMEILMQTILSSKDFFRANLLNFEASLLLDCFFIDESLKKLRWDIDHFHANSNNKLLFSGW